MTFPCKIFDVTGVNAIGIAYCMDDALAILSSDAGWSNIGIPYNGGNNNILWSFKGGNSASNAPAVNFSVSVTNQAITGTTQVYALPITDVVTGRQVSYGDFPFSLYVKASGGTQNAFVGIFSQPTDLLAAFASFVSKINASATVSLANTAQGPIFILVNPAVSTPVALTVGTDRFSGNVTLLGTNNMRSNLGDTQLYSLDSQSNSVNGILPVANQGHPNHSTLIGNTMLTADGSTGIILAYDVTNPKQSKLKGSLQLSTVVSNNFAGTPQYSGINWYYSLYFPSGQTNGNLGAVYVVEALSGTIWLVDMINFVQTGDFQSNTLIGKKPRFMYNGKLYFSQDGNLEAGSGQSSGVATGSVVVLNMKATFNSSALSTVNLNTGHFIVGGDIASNGLAYFHDNNGNVVSYDCAATTVKYQATAAIPTISTFSNSVMWGSTLYISSEGGGTIAYNTATNTYTTFAALNPSQGSSPNLAHFNFAPINTDMGLLTFNNGTYQAGVAKYTLSGTFVSLIQGAFNFYNVIAVPNPLSTVYNTVAP